MSKRTRAKYERVQRVTALLSLVAFLAFLMVPLRFPLASHSLLAAALMVLLVAGVAKILVIKGTPLKNDLEQLGNGAGQGRR